MITILHKLIDGGVGSYPPNPEVVALMVGTGLGWDAERIVLEAAKFQLPGGQGAEDWLGFPKVFAIEWCQALGSGGLTEVEVFGLFTRRTQIRRGYTESVTIEYEELPYHIRGNGDSNHGMCLDPACHDRYFRDAVVWDDTLACKCCCDMPIARGIHMDCIRVVRNAELVKEDITFMRAVEAGDTSAESTIATKKQVLRDIPQTFDLTTDTPEQLKAKWPAELPARE